MMDTVDDDLDYFEVMAVADLPPSEPNRADCLGVSITPRLQILGFTVRQPCCWYHERDWSAISEAAVAILGQASKSGIVRAKDVYKFAQDGIRASGLQGQDRHALYELLCPGIALMVGPSGKGYTNGQHRGQAMKDLNVKRTVVLRWPPMTGEESPCS